MIKKPEFINKSWLFSSLTVLAILTVKMMYEFSRLGKLLPKYIVLNAAAAIALTAFIAVYMVPHLSGSKISGRSIVGLLGFVYLVVFNTDENILRIDVLIFLITISIMLLLVRNVWSLIAVAVAGAVLSCFFWHAAVDCIPAAMCVSLITFAPMFRKEKPLSKKKAKKIVADAEKTSSKTKEKIVFIACECVMAVSFIVTAYVHKHALNIYSLQYNLKFYLFPAVLSAAFVALAITAIKKKRSFLEVIAYLVPVFAFPTASVSEYTMGVDYALALLFALLIICGEDCVASELVQKAFNSVVAKLPKNEKEE